MKYMFYTSVSQIDTVGVYFRKLDKGGQTVHTRNLGGQNFLRRGGQMPPPPLKETLYTYNPCQGLGGLTSLAQLCRNLQKN